MDYNGNDIIHWKAPVVRPASAAKGYSYPAAAQKDGVVYLFYAVWEKDTGRRYLEAAATEDFSAYETIVSFGLEEEICAKGLEWLRPYAVMPEGDALRLCLLGRALSNGRDGCYQVRLDREALRAGKAVLSGGIEAVLPGNGEAVMSGSGEAVMSGNGEAVLPGGGEAVMPGGGEAAASGDGKAEVCKETDAAPWESGSSADKAYGISDPGPGKTPVQELFKGKRRPDWAEGYLGRGSLLQLEESKIQVCFYWGCAQGAEQWNGSLALAVSRDGMHWMTFDRDRATYPENGIIYDGDYCKGIPFRQYISREELPEGKVFDIRAYGAVPNPLYVSTEAFRAAAEAARDAGGGTVLVAGGYYCVGSVFLYDHTTLFIDEDSALCASKDLDAYQDALLACVDGKDITIRGGGKIIGNGEYFAYLPLRRPMLEPMKVTKLPAVLYDPMGYPVDTIRYAYRSRIRYAEDRYAEGLDRIRRPMYTVWIRGCEGVTVENIVIEDSLDWTLSIDFSRKVHVKDVVINGNRHVANTDGIDMMSSEDITVEHCFISCADDGLCVKAPRVQGHDGINVEDASMKMGPSRNIHISDCTVVTVMNAFKIGTETFYDIENVTVENCRFQMPDMYPGSVSGISIESADGSHVRNIQVRNIEMDGVCCPIFINLCMRNKFGLPDAMEPGKAHFGAIEQVLIENVVCRDVEVPSIVTGFRSDAEEDCVEGRIRDIVIRGVRAVYRDNEEVLDIRTPVHENLTDYPENNAFGDVPAYGFYLRHGDGIVLEDYKVVPRTHYHGRQEAVWVDCR